MNYTTINNTNTTPHNNSNPDISSSNNNTTSGHPYAATVEPAINSSVQPATQQKRQNSNSGCMLSNSNKRTPPNPLQFPMAMQSSIPQSPSSHNKQQEQQPQQQQMQPRMLRRNANQSYQQQNASMKTPTPSSFELPSSPNMNQNNMASIQNNSDLSESNALMENDQTQQQQRLSSKEANEYGYGLQQHQVQHQQVQLQLQQQPRTMTDQEQQLAAKLKVTYKNIVNYEEIVQKNCIEITLKLNQFAIYSTNSVSGGSPPSQQQQQQQQMVKTSELLSDLWTIYHHNITLLDNYYDFLVNALKPSSNQIQFKTGKNIVDLYKIPRRMWVYGIVGFLEVLKNIMNVFQDHEICSCFISYCFTIISNLTDPMLEMEGWWSEKLGDLSRMAIALYASKFIDWKISAEHWYSVAMKSLYGHGKIYYHMCTVQQDNLEALVNIGKSVICRDPFVPTQHYLRLVVENICTQRNILLLLELPIIDFIKIHKVLLTIYHHTIDQSSNSSSITATGSATSQSSGISNNNNNNNNNIGDGTASEGGIRDSQVQYGIALVTRYGITFGSDSNGYNFFTRELYTPTGITQIHESHNPYYFQQGGNAAPYVAAANVNLNSVEKMNFWFNKGPLFAIANINHLIGFGDAKNPFAKVFELPEALRERKDKKEKKRKSRAESQGMDDIPTGGTTTSSNNPEVGNNGNISQFLSSNEGSMVFADVLSPRDWFFCLQYINKSVLELSIRILNHYLVGPKQASTPHVIVWLYFMIAVGQATNKFPNSKSMFLWLFRKLFPWQSLINYLNSVLEVVKKSKKLNGLIASYLRQGNYMSKFSNAEFLPEVWQCWGTLWFDAIAPKGDFTDLEVAGVKNSDIFDLPTCGTSPVFNTSTSSVSGMNNDLMLGAGSRVRSMNIEKDNDERIVRILLLAIVLADEYNLGLIRTEQGFRFEKQTFKNTDTMVGQIPDVIPQIEEFLLADGRFVQNNFLQPISAENLSSESMLSANKLNEIWFSSLEREAAVGQPLNNDDNGYEFSATEDFQGYIDDEGTYADSEFENEDNSQQLHNAPRQQCNAQSSQPLHFQQQQLQQSGPPEQQQHFYTSYEVPSDDWSVGNIYFEGDLGDRMDSHLTYITLDANLWLKHCGRIFKCVRNGVIKVLIPLIVFQELRTLRKSTEATIADAATRSIIIIRELFLSNEIVPLRFDGTVAMDINETTELENNSNWRSNIDETILNAVSEHDEIGKKLLKGWNVKIHNSSGTKSMILNAQNAKALRYCILVTDDRNMRLRAKTVGLTSFQSKWLFTQLETAFPYNCID